MGIVVQKFGGSSVADKEKLMNVANIINRTYSDGNNVVVVVSAQGKTTDGLVKKVDEITDAPNKRELDVILSTGEQITISLLAMMLEEMGRKTISYTGWQIPIITDNNHGNAKIKYIKDVIIKEKLKEGYIVIVAGFQGVDNNNEITTLGRGGSDTTAVALAASLKADKCEIYTDVDGVFTGDPRIIKNVKKLDEVSYDDMLELASSGAKVLHNRCVEIAQNQGVEILVKSSMEDGTGTVIREIENLNEKNIQGVTKKDNIVKMAILGVENKIGKTYKIFDLLAKENIPVDIIIQEMGEHYNKDIFFTITKDNLKKTLKIFKENKEEIGAKDIIYTEGLSKISLIGAGMRNCPGFAAKMFEALYENNISIHLISIAEVKIAVLVNMEQSENALRAIHDKFF